MSRSKMSSNSLRPQLSAADAPTFPEPMMVIVIQKVRPNLTYKSYKFPKTNIFWWGLGFHCPKLAKIEILIAHPYRLELWTRDSI